MVLVLLAEAAADISALAVDNDIGVILPFTNRNDFIVDVDVDFAFIFIFTFTFRHVLLRGRLGTNLIKSSRSAYSMNSVFNVLELAFVDFMDDSFLTFGILFFCLPVDSTLL